MGLKMHASRSAIRHKQPAPDVIKYSSPGSISWKTDSPIRVIDPVFFMPVRVTAFGNLSIGKAEEKAAYPKPLGAPSGCSGEELERGLSGLIASKIGCLIADVLTAHKLCLSEIDAHISVISKLLYPKVQELLEPYGIAVSCFQVAGIEHSGLESVEYPLQAERVKSIDFAKQLQLGDAERAGTVRRQRKRRQDTAGSVRTASPLPSKAPTVIQTSTVIQASTVIPVSVTNRRGICLLDQIAIGGGYAKAAHPWSGMHIFNSELSRETLEGSIEFP